jgi:ubiquinone/menaquinone biosynthesis C-methylase UbiE
LPKYGKGKTLDIGGGTSKYREIIRRSVGEYLVADLYQTQGVDFIEDARHLSFEAASFDTVLSFQLLEHVDDVAAAVSEMYRVLKPGGYAIVTMPFLFPQHGDPSDFHRFTVDAAKFHFVRSGFRVVESGSQGSTLTVLAGILRQMYLSHYVSAHGRLRRAIWTRIFALLGRLDTWGVMCHPDVYSNVYIVGTKD